MLSEYLILSINILSINCLPHGFIGGGSFHMRRQYIYFAIVIASLAFMAVSTTPVFAGVVMAETSVATGPDGQINSQEKTIYLQGNKQKVDRKDVAAITDLDKNIIYIIDKQHRAYAKLPIPALAPSDPSNGSGEAIKLDRTGAERTIANHPCSEYRASEGDQLEHVTITACVSTTAPGAKEISEFERKMVARLTGHTSEPSTEHQTAAVMLEKQSVVSFRIPDPSQHRPYRTASLRTQTRVNQIQLKPLPPETFQPPKGFNQFRSEPQETAPPMSPDASGHSIEVIGPNPAGLGQAGKL
jgi:Domain of unknown function (DUF4412)